MTRAFGPIHDLRLKIVVTRGPIAKTIVAAKRSQGITASNAFCEVDSKSTAPLMPPAMLATIAGLTGMFKVSISFRYAQAKGDGNFKHPGQTGDSGQHCGRH